MLACARAWAPDRVQLHAHAGPALPYLGEQEEASEAVVEPGREAMERPDGDTRQRVSLHVPRPLRTKVSHHPHMGIRFRSTGEQTSCCRRLFCIRSNRKMKNMAGGLF